MVAITNGEGLGLYNTSLNLIGNDAGQGKARLGRNGDNVYVNTQTGNLVVQAQDEFISGLGLDFNLVRTYNSLGQKNDDNGDNWRLGVNRRVHSLSGTVNQDGSSVIKSYKDGFEALFTYDQANNHYISTDGDGAHDILTFDGTNWTFWDGNSSFTEEYTQIGTATDGSAIWGVSRVVDSDQNEIKYNYGGGSTPSQFVSKIELLQAEGIVETVNLVYDPKGNLTKIASTVRDTKTQAVESRARTHYTYDALNRLTQVIVDLSPDSLISAISGTTNSTINGQRYVTTYTYRDDVSHLISNITSGDGVSISFTYNAAGQLQTVSDVLGNETRYTYPGERVVSTGTLQTLPQTTQYAAINPHVAMSANGSGVAAWIEDNTTSDFSRGYSKSIFVSHYTMNEFGGSWGEPKSITVGAEPAIGQTTPTVTFYDLKVAIDDAGNAMIAWQENDGAELTSSNYYLMTRFYDAATQTWQSEQQHTIQNMAANYDSKRLFELKTGGTGAFYLMYNQDSPSPEYNDIVLDRFVAGSGWTGAQFINDRLYGTTFNLYPVLDVTESGNASVAWSRGNLVKVTDYIAGVGVQPTQNQFITNTYANIAHDSDTVGNRLMVWYNAGVLGTSYYDAMSDTTTTENIDSVLTSSTYRNKDLKLLNQGEGNWVLFWKDNQEVFSKRFDSATGWSTTTSVATQQSFTSHYLYFDYEVHQDDQGRMALVWREQNGPSTLFVRYSLDGANWTSPSQVAASDSSIYGPYLSVNELGFGLLSWSEIVSGEFVNKSINLDLNKVASAIALPEQLQTTKIVYAGDFYPGWLSNAEHAVATNTVYSTSAQAEESIDVASNTSGQGVAVWIDNDVLADQSIAQSKSLYISRYQQSGTNVNWQAAITLVDGQAMSTRMEAPQVLIDDAGNITVAYYEMNLANTSGNLMVMFYDASTNSWSAPTVKAPVSFPEWKPFQLHQGHNGDVYLVWTEGNTSTNPQPIKADRYVLGSGWIGETYLGGTYNADFNATVLPDGGLEVVWEISRAVRTMRYSVATGWAASQKLSIPGFGVLDGGNNIKLESDGLGNRLMVFVQASSPKINLWYSEGGAAWSTGFVVDTISSTLYNTNINPEIFKLDGDQWLVTWKNGGNLYTRVFDSVNGLSDTKLLGATSRGNSNYFDYRIEQDKQGRIVALWEDGASGAAVVKSRYYVPGRGWSDEVAQDGVGTGNKVLVDLSLDEQGQAFYLWNDWSSVGGGLIENNLSSHTFNFFSPTYQEFTLPPFHTVSASDTWENIAFAIYGDEQLAVSLQEYFASQGVTSLVEGMDLIMPLNFYYVKNETTSTRTMVEDLTRNTQTNYFLDEQNRLHEFYDQNQNRMVYGYDEDGRSSDNITSITDQNGNITRFAYDDQGNRTSMIDSEGVRVDYEYNDVNQIISETRYRVNDPDGADINNTGTGGVGASDAQSSFYIYDAEQHLVFTVSSEGVVNEYVYDTQGRQISQILYKGHIDTSALDPATPISATLLNQAPYNSVVNVGNILQRSDTTYDFRGNISTVTTFDSINPTTGAGVTTTASTTHFVYDAQGILIETIEAQAAATGETRDFITTFTYDGLGRLLASNKPLNHTTTYFYDDVGNQIVRTDANELQTTTVYDSHGYAISQSQQDGQLNPLGTIEYKYDSSGNLRLTIDQTGNYSQNYYDATNRLVATVDKEGGLTETVYDDAGRVIKTIEYSTPVLQSIVNYPYVAGSNFYELSAIKPNSSPSDRINYFIYDDADRLVMQLTPYDNDVTRVAVTQHFYDGSNQLTHSIAYANPFVITGMPNNPRAEYFLDSTTGTYVNEDANNDRRTRFFYNNDGQLVATLDAEGYLTETEYNAAGQVVKTSAYANRSTANLASASLQQLKDAIVRNLAKDQYSYNFYNAKGQLIANHDAEGYLSTFSYDLNGNETESIRYNNKALIISAKGIPADGTYPIMEVRVDGVLVDSIVVDSENFKDYQINALFDQRDTYTIDLTFVNNDLTSRDLQIQSITTGEHQQVVATPDTYSVSVAHGLIQKRLAHVNDKTIVKTYTELNQMETVTNSVDGLVTSYAYDDVGNLIRQTDSYLNALLEFADLDVSLAPENGYTVQSGDTWESIVRSVYHTANANAFVAFAELMGAASPTVGEMLNLPGRFSYTHNQRSSLLRYDIQGRLIGEQLNAQGIAKLDTLINPSESELDLLWEIYGVTHTYNEQGLRTSTKDQNDHRTWFYYDDNGRLRFTAQDVSGTLDESGKVLSNVAEVNELSYNQFGEVKETVAYSTRITNSNTLTGGLVTPSFLDRLSGNTMVDSRTQSSYNLRGAIWRAINGEGQRTEYAYNAFGQISSSVQQQDPTLIPVSQALTGQTSRSDTYVYDRRGLSTSTLKDVSVAGHTGLEIETKRTYDAFGRVIQSTDGNSNITQFGYDRLGRQVQTRNALDVSRSQTYDAFGRVLTMTDAFLNVTTYAYDDATHTLTVTTPELIQTQTITDRNGQTIKIIDGNQSAANSNDGTEYHYDTNGKLVKVVDMLNNTITSEYDKAGRLTHTVDKNGVYSKFEYDAANRVMTRTVDPMTIHTTGDNETGLNIQTQYVFDGLGRKVTTIDANGVHTDTEYDRAGNVLAVVVDAVNGGLNLRTEYTYDAEGRQLTVTEGANSTQARETQYIYDHLGRRTDTIVDPGGLNITTKYYYDAADNMVRKVEGYRRVDVSGLSGSLTLNYAFDDQTLTSSYYVMWSNVTSLATDRILLKENGTTVYDSPADSDFGRYRRGRSGFTYELVLLRNGLELSVATVLPFTPALGAFSETSEVAFATDLSAEDTSHSMRYVYDDVNRLRYSIKNADVLDFEYMELDPIPTGQLAVVVESVYNDRGDKVKTIQYALPISTTTLDDHSTEADILSLVSASADLAKDIVDYSVFDDDGRLTVTVNAVGNYTVYEYDDNGNVIRQSRLANSVSTTDLATINSTNTELLAQTILQKRPDVIANDQGDHFAYDKLNRLRYSVDAMGYVNEKRYDASGQVILSMRYASKETTFADYKEATIRGNLAGNSSTDQINHYFYDNAGRKIYSIDALGYVNQTSYDALGQAIVASRFYQALTINSYQDSTPTAAEWNTYLETRINTLNRQVVDVTETTPLVTATSGKDRVSFQQYDAAGRVSFSVDAEGYVTGREYTGDLLSRVTQYANQLQVVNDTTAEGFPESGVATLATQRFDVRNEGDIQLLVSGTNLLYRNSDTTSGDRSTRYVYDDAGRLYQEILENVSYTTHSTDENGDLVTEYGYDAFGNTTSIVKRLNISGDELQRTTQEFSQRGLLTRRTVYLEAASVVANLDTAHPQTQMAYSSEFGYDAFGNQTKIIDPRGIELTETDSDWADNERKLILGLTATTNLSYIQLTQDQKDTLLNYYSTYQTFDQLNRKTASVIKEGAGSTVNIFELKKTDYDAFGNITKITEPYDTISYFYYDKLDRNTLVVDPERYVTTKAYDGMGNLTGTMQYATAIAAAHTVDDNTTESQILETFLEINTDKDQKTLLNYDQLNRKTELTNAESVKEKYDYDAFGNQIGKLLGHQPITNVLDPDYQRSLGYQYHYNYDRKGNLTSEYLPIANKGGISDRESIEVGMDGRFLLPFIDFETTGFERQTNEFSYDAFGNRRISREAAGMEEERSRSYTYNKLNLLVKTENHRIKLSAGDSVGITTTIEQKYNVVGNLVREIDANLNITQHYYDNLGRRIATHDAEGFLKTFAYDSVSNIIEERKYRDTATFADSIYKFTVSNVYMQLTHRYDAFNQIVETKLPAEHRYEKDRMVPIGDPGDDQFIKEENYVSETVIRKYYDHKGRLVREVDGNENSIFHYYDKKGNKRVTVDALRYATQWNYDAFNNAIREEKASIRLRDVVDENTSLLEVLEKFETNGYEDRIVQVNLEEGYFYPYFWQVGDGMPSVMYVKINLPTLKQGDYYVIRAARADGTYHTTFPTTTILTKGTIPLRSYNTGEIKEFVITLISNSDSFEIARVDTNLMLGSQGWHSGYSAFDVNRLKISDVDYVGGVWSASLLREGETTATPVDVMVNENGEAFFDVGNISGRATVSYILQDNDRVIKSGSINLSNVNVATNGGYNFVIESVDLRDNQYSDSRIKNYSFDKLNRLKTDSLENFQTYSFSNGNMQSGVLEDSVTAYVYDVMGNITTIVDAESNTTNYSFDVLGRLLTKKSGLKSTKNIYDAHGNVIEARNIASEKDSESRNIPLNGAPSLANLDQIQKFSYGVDGRLLEDWDANFNANVSEEYGANNKYTYDAVGNVRTQSLNRHDADGNLFTDIAEYIYDRLNRNIVSGKRTEKNSSVYAYFENKYTEYNGYEKAAFQGAYERNTLQLSRPEANKARQVFFEYDSNGNLIKTNSDGVVKEYAYDRNGNATKEILPSITDNNAPSVYRSSVYNERNELVHIYEPSHTQSISQTLYQTLSDRKVDIEVTPYGGLHLRVHDAVGKDWAETWWDAVDPNVDSIKNSYGEGSLVLEFNPNNEEEKIITYGSGGKDAHYRTPKGHDIGSRTYSATIKKNGYTIASVSGSFRDVDGQNNYVAVDQYYGRDIILKNVPKSLGTLTVEIRRVGETEWVTVEHFDTPSGFNPSWQTWNFGDAGLEGQFELKYEYHYDNEATNPDLTPHTGKVILNLSNNPSVEPGSHLRLDGNAFSSDDGDNSIEARVTSFPFMDSSLSWYYIRDVYLENVDPAQGTLSATIRQSGGETYKEIIFRTITDSTRQRYSVPRSYSGDYVINYTYKPNDPNAKVLQGQLSIDLTGEASLYSHRRVNSSDNSDPDQFVQIHKSHYYNAFGEIVQEKDGKDIYTYFEYDKMGNLIRKSNPRKDPIRNSYYSRLQTIQDANAIYYYDKLGNVTGITDARNNLKRFSYDQNGLKQEFNPDGGGMTYVYDGFGNVIEKRQKLTADSDRVTKYQFDHNNQITYVTKEKHNVIKYVLGSFGGITEETSNIYDNVEKYEYDENGNRIAHINLVDTSLDLTDPDTNSHDEILHDQGGGRERTYFDALGRVVKHVSYGDKVTRYDYNYLTFNGQEGGFSKTTYSGNLYIVRSGDTLESIARQLLRVSEVANRIGSDNGVVDETLVVGNTLTVYLYGRREKLNYIVQTGDTLASIAYSLLNVEDMSNSIGQANNITDADLKAGLQIIIPHYETRAITDQYDYFNKLVYHRDLGNRSYRYFYDARGQLRYQIGNTDPGASIIATDAAWNNIDTQLHGFTYDYMDLYRYSLNNFMTNHSDYDQVIEFDYNDNGSLKAKVDYGFNGGNDGVRLVSRYGYDNNGNKTYEAVYEEGANADIGKDYQYTIAIYDDYNRVVEINDPFFNITYDYDEMGNRIHVVSKYHGGIDLNAHRGADYREATGDFVQEHWYDYDSMNRFRITQGRLDVGGSGNVEIAENKGYEVLYNLAGERIGVNYIRANTTMIERYGYTKNGILETVEHGKIVDNVEDKNLVSRRLLDALGRTSSSHLYDPDIETVVTTIPPQSVQQYDYSYDLDSRISRIEYRKRVENSEDQFLYLQEQSTIHNDYTYREIDRLDLAEKNVSYQVKSIEEQKNFRNSYFYSYWDSAKKSVGRSDVNSRGFVDGYSHLYYDQNGHLMRMDDSNSPLHGTKYERRVEFTVDADGRIIMRNEIDNTNYDVNRYFYLNGRGIGEVSNRGAGETDYTQILAQSRLSNKEIADNEKRGKNRVISADFDQNYQAISANYPANTASEYLVVQGDTLETIAGKVWGDASLWYVIANANNITNIDLTPGISIIIPNVVTNIHNNADTFKPYSPGEIIGSTDPSMPARNQPSKSEIFWMNVASVVISIAAFIVFGPQGAIIAAGMTSYAIQKYMKNVGYIDEIDEEEIVKSMTIAAIISQIPGLNQTGGGVVKGALQGAGRALISTGLSMAMESTEQRKKYNSQAGNLFANVAVGALVGGVTSSLPSNVGKVDGWGFAGVAGDAIRGALTGVGRIAVNSMTLKDYRPDWRTVAVEALSSAASGYISAEQSTKKFDNKLDELKINDHRQRQAIKKHYTKSIRKGVSGEDAWKSALGELPLFGGIQPGRNLIRNGGKTYNGYGQVSVQNSAPGKIPYRQSSDAVETKPILTFKNGQLVDENGTLYNSQLASAAPIRLDFSGSLDWYENAMVSDDVYQEYTGKEPKKVTEDIYRMGRDFIDVLDMKPENFVDKKSGYQGALYFNYRTSEFIFANRGTDTKLGRHEAVKDAVASIAQGSDFNSTQYEFGINLAIDLQIALGSSPLTFTGHSLGGGIASAQAGRLKSSAVTFNAAGLSDGTIERYGMDRNHLKKNVYAFYTPGEILSTLQASPVVDSVLNQWGTVPKNLLAAVMALNDVSYGRDIGWHRFGPGQMPEAAGTRIAVPAVNEAKQPLPWQSYLDPVDLHDMQYFINAFK